MVIINSSNGNICNKNWSSQLITQIWKLVYSQWIHCSKINHAGEALGDNTKEIILDSKITDEHSRGQDTLSDRYNPCFGTPLSTILDASITARKN